MDLLLRVIMGIALPADHSTASPAAEYRSWKIPHNPSHNYRVLWGFFLAGTRFQEISGKRIGIASGIILIAIGLRIMLSQGG